MIGVSIAVGPKSPPAGSLVYVTATEWPAALHSATVLGDLAPDPTLTARHRAENGLPLPIGAAALVARARVEALRTRGRPS